MAERDRNVGRRVHMEEKLQEERKKLQEEGKRMEELMMWGIGGMATDPGHGLHRGESRLDESP